MKEWEYMKLGRDQETGSSKTVASKLEIQIKYPGTKARFSG